MIQDRDRETRIEIECEVIKLLELSALVTLANNFYHITPEEAGLHYIEITKDIVRLFRDRAKRTTIGPERSVPEGTEILFFFKDELNEGEEIGREAQTS